MAPPTRRASPSAVSQTLFQARAVRCCYIRACMGWEGLCYRDSWPLPGLHSHPHFLVFGASLLCTLVPSINDCAHSIPDNRARLVQQLTLLLHIVRAPPPTPLLSLPSTLLPLSPHAPRPLPQLKLIRPAPALAMSHSHQPHAHGNGNGAKPDDKDDDHSLKDKIKHPFHELKEKLEGTHLHSLKVGLIHKKCACPLVA